jgi:Rab-GTPase-TBC domain
MRNKSEDKVTRDHQETLSMPDSQKITFKEIIKSILDRDKSEKLQARFYQMMGATGEMERLLSMHKRERLYTKNIMKKVDFEKYLKYCGRKGDNCTLMRVVIKKFYTTQKEISKETRLRMWKILADIKTNMKKNPDYYSHLIKFDDKAAQEFSGIIGMDVKRTPDAIASEEHARKLTNILLAYSMRNSKVGYCQGLNMLGSYFLSRGLTEEVSCL